MRYNQIRECDIVNGEGIGIALFVQGCHFKCHNCFNPETWDFTGGKVWTTEIKNKFLELAAREYVKRISILGGEPLADENLDAVLDLVDSLHTLYPQKKIWMYSGYNYQSMMSSLATEESDSVYKRQKVLNKIDILVDGQYIDEQRDITLLFRGSANQRIIDCKASQKNGHLILWQQKEGECQT